LRVRHVIAPIIAVAALGAASTAYAAGSGGGGTNQQATATSGGAGVAPGPGPRSTSSHPVVQGFTAKIVHGVGYAPSYAPAAVQRMIWAGDKIRHKPYCYAGGHGQWTDSCYDCSGTVSYVMHAAGLINTSMDSGEMMSWGDGGGGKWVTIYTNSGHAFIEIAGIRLDTSAYQDPTPQTGSGPRWRPDVTSWDGFVRRHPAGL
jgi:hypothetical protein